MNFSEKKKYLLILFASFFIVCQLQMSRQLMPCIRNFSFCINQKNKENSVSLYLKKFDGLKKIIPSASIIGYQDDRTSPSDEEKELHYYLAQYALAPVVIYKNDKPDTLLINSFTSDIDTATWNIIFKQSELMLITKK